MSASAVIAALRARLEAADYDVVLFRTIDAERDELPVVAIHFGESGEITQNETGIPRSELELEVVYVFEGDGEDPELEAVQAAEALRDVLISHTTDRQDRIDGSCERGSIVGMGIETRENTSDLLIAHVTVLAEYSR